MRFDKESTALFRRLIVLVTLLAASPAAAQNASTPGALELYANPNAIGVRLAYSGDANANATARLEWRTAGSGAWIPGFVMTRITNQRWAGSIFWLTPGTSYEVRAVIEDPDGGGNAQGSTTTPTGTLPPPTGRTWWVAPNGDDASAGTEASPLRTIAAGVAKANAGEEIRVKPGIYYETLDTPRSGTASAPIHLVAHGPGVILDGSDQAMLHRSDWRDDGDGVFSVPFSGAPLLVCADSLQRLYHHGSVSALRANANGVAQGWVIEGGRLNVKLEDRSSPNNHTMHVSKLDVGIQLDQSYWKVSGFEIRYYGLSAVASGVYLRTAVNCVVSDNHIHTIGGNGVYLRVDARNNIIERNLIRDPRIATWPWSATKAHDEEVQGISNRGGRGNVFRFNTVAGIFDGIDCTNGQADENIGADTDIHENFISGVSDDAFEPEFISGINVRLWRNRADGCFSALSIAPMWQGPTYVLYNMFTNYTRNAYKFSIDQIGELWIMHNTAWSSNGGTAPNWPTGAYSNVHFRNNILVGNGKGASNDDAGESQSGNDWEGDLLHVTGTSTLFRWKGVNYGSLSSLRSATGFEMLGRSGDPQFVAAGAGDFTLASGSPAIDGGIRYPGINDVYSGSAPDMGAWEFGGPDVTPPASITDLRVSGGN